MDRAKSIIAAALALAVLLPGCAGGGAEKAESDTSAAEGTTGTEEIALKDDDVLFEIDTASPGKTITNKVSDVNCWMYQYSWLGGVDVGGFSQTLPFVSRVQFMQATGGNAERDLFKDPLDLSVRDDYDFSTLVEACRRVLETGAKPMLKTGNVPMKLSAVSTPGVFGVNLYPPDHYGEYYRYIAAMTRALADSFGAEEVKSWSFGVLTEYENADWFSTGDAEQTFEAYCKLYDYTAAAIESVLGEGIDIGAHSMSVSEGLWDERRFIEHCARGRNYCTGETGSPITFLSVSFYDNTVQYSRTTLRSLPDTVNIVRRAAEDCGLTGLRYGVDEGRILAGAKGLLATDLTDRVVGYTYQAAYDARLLRQMVENDIDWFSAWGYTSGGLCAGIPTVSLHVARGFYGLVGARQLPAERSGRTKARTETEALAALADDGSVKIMAYNYGTAYSYSEARNFIFSLALPSGKYRITCRTVDDEANFFDEWKADCLAAGIPDTDFSWSPDGAQEGNMLGAARELFRLNYERYMAASELEERVFTAISEDGRLVFELPAPPYAVLFAEIAPEG